VSDVTRPDTLQIFPPSIPEKLHPQAFQIGQSEKIPFLSRINGDER
jgi:hypothetical protein